MPIGISKTTVATPIKGWPAGDYAGVTCAACHEGELIYKGKRIRIQGGNSRTIDLPGLSRVLDWEQLLGELFLQCIGVGDIFASRRPAVGG